MNVTPDPEEIVQAEDDYEGKPVEVTVCGPLETRELPALGYPGYKTDQDVGTAVAVKLLSMEPRRKQAVIIAQDQDVWISHSQAGAQSGAAGAMRIPAVLPYVITHAHEVWVCAVTGTTDVSVESVYWSQ
ncbi:hypothetical protein [Streptomyces luteogriseus]|uniref:hypothetical protein n=1 Tax=Streptomyces luteogriseus TaxID=68233 RepID=UPI002603BDC1|nr:hypothetical protein [uncultured Streptomyces sp.]